MSGWRSPIWASLSLLSELVLPAGTSAFPQQFFAGPGWQLSTAAAVAACPPELASDLKILVFCVHCDCCSCFSKVESMMYNSMCPWHSCSRSLCTSNTDCLIAMTSSSIRCRASSQCCTAVQAKIWNPFAPIALTANGSGQQVLLVELLVWSERLWLWFGL